MPASLLLTHCSQCQHKGKVVEEVASDVRERRFVLSWQGKPQCVGSSVPDAPVTTVDEPNSGEQGKKVRAKRGRPKWQKKGGGGGQTYSHGVAAVGAFHGEDATLVNSLDPGYSSSLQKEKNGQRIE